MEKAAQEDLAEILRTVNRLRNRTETAAREAHHLKNQMETEARLQAANHLKSRITTTKFSIIPLLHDRSLHDHSRGAVFRYLKQKEKYFYFFVKYI